MVVYILGKKTKKKLELIFRAMYTRECFTGKSFVFATLDNGMGGWAHKREVLSRLQQR